MSDFDPAVRNAAWWSGDSRLVANGRGFEAVAIKLGKMEREDISHLENVRMGHTMQPVIARLWEDKHEQRLKDYDIAGTHPCATWLRCHFDYITIGIHITKSRIVHSNNSTSVLHIYWRTFD